MGPILVLTLRALTRSRRLLAVMGLLAIPALLAPSLSGQSCC